MADSMNPFGMCAWSKNLVSSNSSYTLMLLFAWIKYLIVQIMLAVDDFRHKCMRCNLLFIL